MAAPWNSEGQHPARAPGHAQGRLKCFLILMEIGHTIIIQTFKHDSLLCIASDINDTLSVSNLCSSSLYSMLCGLRFNRHSKHYFAIVDFLVLFASIF